MHVQRLLQFSNSSQPFSPATQSSAIVVRKNKKTEKHEEDPILDDVLTARAFSPFAQCAAEWAEDLKFTIGEFKIFTQRWLPSRILDIINSCTERAIVGQDIVEVPRDRQKSQMILNQVISKLMKNYQRQIVDLKANSGAEYIAIHKFLVETKEIALSRYLQNPANISNCKMIDIEIVKKVSFLNENVVQVIENYWNLLQVFGSGDLHQIVLNSIQEDFITPLVLAMELEYKKKGDTIDDDGRFISTSFDVLQKSYKLSLDKLDGNLKQQLRRSNEYYLASDKQKLLECSNKIIVFRYLYLQVKLSASTWMAELLRIYGKKFNKYVKSNIEDYVKQAEEECKIRIIELSKPTENEIRYMAHAKRDPSNMESVEMLKDVRLDKLKELKQATYKNFRATIITMLEHVQKQIPKRTQNQQILLDYFEWQQGVPFNAKLIQPISDDLKVGATKDGLNVTDFFMNNFLAKDRQMCSKLNLTPIIRTNC